MKKILLLAVTVAFASFSFAQKKSVIVLGGSKSSNSSSNSKHTKYQEPSMAIKVGALNFIAGNLPICFEKEYKNFGFLVGAGPTFRRFYDNSFWSTLLDEDGIEYSWGNNPSIGNVYNPFDYAYRPKFTYSTGYYLVANPRYYYNEEGMDGGYIGIQIVKSQYTYKTSGTSGDYAPSPYSYSKESGRDRYTDLTVQWGAQYGENKFIFEWFTGMGIRFKDEQRYAFGFDQLGNVVTGTAVVNKASIHFDLGLRMGFKF